LRSVQSFPKVYAAILGICLIGCGDSISSPVTTDNANALWSVPFNYHAVNLSLEPGSNTVQLTAIPRTSTGAQFRGAESVLYTALDSTVTVSATGLVTAHFVTGTTQVVAQITSKGVTVSDTAMIRVTPTPLAAPLATLSIQPRPG